MERRAVLCLRIAEGYKIPRQAIEGAGWFPYPALSTDDALRIIEAENPRVGLVFFDRYYLNGGSNELEYLLQQSGTMEWVGLIEPENLSLNKTRQLIAHYLSDYHTLPIDDERLMNSLGHAYGMARIRHTLNERSDRYDSGCHMVAVSPLMHKVFNKIDRIASVDASVMISGESGTGKELAARAIHEKSPRADGPFVALNCGSIHASLIQTELFGHEKGSFSGAHKRSIGRIESADGGTLFLDEIGDLPLELQVNFLRFLQERTINRVGGNEPIPVDVRVITATHRDLQEAVARQTFRDDLYYRLHVLALRLPSLRDRPEDIQPLARYFLTKFQGESRQRIRGFSRSAMRCLQSYAWPGNVRELINRVERAVVMCEGCLIKPEDLEFNQEPDSRPVQSLADSRAEADRAAISRALRSCGNNVTEAARQLEVSRVTLYRLMDKFGMDLKGNQEHPD